MRKMLLLFVLLPSLAIADDIVSTKYATARSYNVSLRDTADVNDFINSVSFTSGDCAASACCKITKNGAALQNCTNQPTALANGGYNITITAAELTSACQTKLYLVDAAGSKRFADKAVSFMTYGNALACHQTPDVNVLSFDASAEADIKTQVTEVMTVDTHAELSALPGTSPTILESLQYVYQMMRNKLTTTATQQKTYKNNGTTALGTSTQSDDGTTFTRGKFN